MTTRLDAIAEWVAKYGQLYGFGAWADPTLNEWIGKLDTYGATATELTAVSDLMRQSPMDPGEAKSLSSHWPWIMQALNSVRAHNRAEKDAAEAAGLSRPSPTGCEYGCTHGLVIVPHYEDVCMVNHAWRPGLFGTCGVACICREGDSWRQLSTGRGRLALIEQVDRALPNWRELMGQREAIIAKHQQKQVARQKGRSGVARGPEADADPASMGGVFDEYLKKRKRGSR